MNKPTVGITLEDGPWPGAEYRFAWPVGGTVRGETQVVTTDEMSKCAVHVELAWETEGRGNKDTETCAKITVHEGALHGQGTFTFPFELPVPPGGPVTFDGHYIRVRWFVRTVVDIPWAIDVKESSAITVLPVYDGEQ